MITPISKGFVTTTFLLSAVFCRAGETGQVPLAPKPPMGWNSWNCFHGKIDERQIREIGDIQDVDNLLLEFKGKGVAGCWAGARVVADE